MLKLMTAVDWEDLRQKDATLFPGAHYGCRRDLVLKLPQEFEAAIASGSEEALQKLITKNPYLLQYVSGTTGHHGIWAFPKRWIRTNQVNGQPGLIPDYLAVMRNSLGYSWHIIELKRPDVQFANKRGDGFSHDAHKALIQCAEYLHHFADYIENARANIGDERVKQPRGATIIIGDARHENDAQRSIRAKFQEMCPKISVVTYDRLRRGLMGDMPASMRAAMHAPGSVHADFLDAQHMPERRSD